MNAPDFRTPYVARQQKHRAYQPADMAVPAVVLPAAFWAVIVCPLIVAALVVFG